VANSRQPGCQKQHRHAVGIEADEKMLTGRESRRLDERSLAGRDGTVTPNDEPGCALTERGKSTRERHGEDQLAAHSPIENDGLQNTIGSQDRTENNRHQMQIKSIQPQENQRPAFDTEIRGRRHGLDRWLWLTAR
jgi:hypothetical protein